MTISELESKESSTYQSNSNNEIECAISHVVARKRSNARRQQRKWKTHSGDIVVQAPHSASTAITTSKTAIEESVIPTLVRPHSGDYDEMVEAQQKQLNTTLNVSTPPPPPTRKLVKGPSVVSTTIIGRSDNDKEQEHRTDDGVLCPDSSLSALKSKQSRHKKRQWISASSVVMSDSVLSEWHRDVEAILGTVCSESDRSSDLTVFRCEVSRLRAQMPWKDSTFNADHLCAAIFEGCDENNCNDGDEFNVIVLVPSKGTCSVICDSQSTVGQLISQVKKDLSVCIDTVNCVLKVFGCAEYMDDYRDRRLCNFEYVNSSRRFGNDVVLILIDRNSMTPEYARTEADDLLESNESYRTASSGAAVLAATSRDKTALLLETFASASEKLMELIDSSEKGKKNNDSVVMQLETTGLSRLLTQLLQCAKMVVNTLGQVETNEMNFAIDMLQQLQGRHCSFSTTSFDDMRDIRWALRCVTEAVNDTVGMYVRVCDVEGGAAAAVAAAAAAADKTSTTTCPLNLPHHIVPSVKQHTQLLHESLGTFKVWVRSLHRLPTALRSCPDGLILEICLYLGGRPLGLVMRSAASLPRMGIFERIVWDEWLDTGILMCQLPRETRACIVVRGRVTQSNETASASTIPVDRTIDNMVGGNSASILKGSETEWTPLAWVNLALFNSQDALVCSDYLLPMWPISCSGMQPNPIGTTAPNDIEADPFAPILHLGFDVAKNGTIIAPVTPIDLSAIPKQFNNDSDESNSTNDPNGGWQSLNISNVSSGRLLSSASRTLSLDSFQRTSSFSSQLKRTLTSDSLSVPSASEMRMLWEHRDSLVGDPRALPRVLASVNPLDPRAVIESHKLLLRWKPPKPLEALALLQPDFADEQVRRYAVHLVGRLPDDDLRDILPQLVQALKYQNAHGSALATLLLQRAFANPRISHTLFWLLRAEQTSPQFAWRVEAILHALISSCGARQRVRFKQQRVLVEELGSIARKLQKTKESSRKRVLKEELESLSSRLPSNVSLPLNPAWSVGKLRIDSCGVFKSKTIPLRLVFDNAESTAPPIHVIFKVGDDLRQDMLTLQLIRIMDKLWLREGIDLRMITYGALATGHESGMVELVTHSVTLRAIQTEENGVIGSFRDRPLDDWLRRHNPSPADYNTAVENFTRSCAGYCVATYVLGVCDRHNDNIMVKRSGLLFHIDFGRFLGNFQMFGNIKRDRTPMVFTPDFLYVITAGKGTRCSAYKRFVQLCSDAFNVLRRNASVLINLFGLMLSSGLPELQNKADINYVRDALFPGLSSSSAARRFHELLEASLSGSKATMINFFVHNLASSNPLASILPVVKPASTLLSFSPKTYTVESDGRIRSAAIIGFEKRYTPDKVLKFLFLYLKRSFFLTFSLQHYIYKLEIVRETPLPGHPASEFIFRRFSEFHELSVGLVDHFASNEYNEGGVDKRLPVFPDKVFFGRSSVRKVAEKRFEPLDVYLQALLSMRAEVAESDLLFTFLHTLPRDETEMKNRREEEGGQNGPPSTFSPRMNAKVLYDYRPSRTDELELCVGDVLEDVREEADGWWVAELRGVRGYVPSNYLSYITDDRVARQPTLRRESRPPQVASDSITGVSEICKHDK